ncbi:hypothetical protein Glove_114g131 [Diversispora epigaea]|uniref:Alpha-mannosidase Ams1-like N-terminal domain-containing protein n=1 Tax=Diversispora epigaea TaxID=1348612 RepID=A0A397J1E8_9GLOM|nr:hypothetical protein Glove_114g131 [Diversispora epigaea]
MNSCKFVFTSHKKRTESEKYIKLQVYKAPQLLRISLEVMNLNGATLLEKVQFLWNINNEGMIWATDGTPLQGLTGDSDRHVEYTRQSHEGENLNSI